MTPRAWWRKKRRDRLEFIRALGYGDGYHRHPHEHVGGTTIQWVYDLAYGRGDMDFKQEARKMAVKKRREMEA